MSVINRFSQLQKEKETRPKKRSADVGAEDAEEAAPTRGGHGSAPAQTSKGGWQVVEPRSKPKPKKTTSEGQQQQQRPAGAPKVKRDPGPKPPPGQPVGATLLDPAVEKAQRKAAQALQRHYAKQQAPQREARDPVAPGEDNAKPTLDAAHGAKGLVAAWLGPELPPAKHHDPHHTEIHFVKNHVDSKPQGKKGAAQKSASVWGTTATPADEGRPRTAQNKKAKASAAAPPAANSGPGVAKKSAEASAKIHEHLDDGSVIPDVSFQFVIQNVTNKGCRTIPLTGRDGGINPKALELFAKPLKVVKGGFFISAEQKSWSNESTVDEPWMIDSYFKALIPILKKEATESVAYPFWPKAQDGEAASEAEAKVTMKLVPGHATALELEHEDHHCSIKVMTRRAKVSLRHFAEKLLAEAEMLVKFIAAVSPQLAGSETLKAFPNVERLTSHMDECRAALSK